MWLVPTSKRAEPSVRAECGPDERVVSQTTPLDIYTNQSVCLPMPRPTKLNPERGDARVRLLEAARDAIRARGFSATTVDDLCKAAGVTKGAFFHHFASKEALGVAVAGFWAESTSTFFAAAPYHDHDDPFDRLIGYVEFRKALIEGDLAEFTCLVGTMTQEVYGSYPVIRDACAASIFSHAATLEPDIEGAVAVRGIDADWTSASLAAHTQAVLQGAFILAKATGDRAVARDSVDHLKRYIEMLFGGEAERTASLHGEPENENA